MEGGQTNIISHNLLHTEATFYHINNYIVNLNSRKAGKIISEQFKMMYRGYEETLRKTNSLGFLDH